MVAPAGMSASVLARLSADDRSVSAGTLRKSSAFVGPPAFTKCCLWCSSDLWLRSFISDVVPAMDEVADVRAFGAAPGTVRADLGPWLAWLLGFVGLLLGGTVRMPSAIALDFPTAAGEDFKGRPLLVGALLLAARMTGTAAAMAELPVDGRRLATLPVRCRRFRDTSLAVRRRSLSRHGGAEWRGTILPADLRRPVRLESRCSKPARPARWRLPELRVLLERARLTVLPRLARLTLLPHPRRRAEHERTFLTRPLRREGDRESRPRRRDTAARSTSAQPPSCPAERLLLQDRDRLETSLRPLSTSSAIRRKASGTVCPVSVSSCTNWEARSGSLCQYSKKANTCPRLLGETSCRSHRCGTLGLRAMRPTRWTYSAMSLMPKST